MKLKWERTFRALCMSTSFVHQMRATLDMKYNRKEGENVIKKKQEGHLTM
jgi:hypothetical protein